MRPPVGPRKRPATPAPATSSQPVVAVPIPYRTHTSPGSGSNQATAATLATKRRNRFRVIFNTGDAVLDAELTKLVIKVSSILQAEPSSDFGTTELFRVTMTFEDDLAGSFQAAIQRLYKISHGTLITTPDTFHVRIEHLDDHGNVATMIELVEVNVNSIEHGKLNYTSATMVRAKVHFEFEELVVS